MLFKINSKIYWIIQNLGEIKHSMDLNLRKTINKVFLFLFDNYIYRTYNIISK